MVTRIEGKEVYEHGSWVLVVYEGSQQGTAEVFLFEREEWHREDGEGIGTLLGHLGRVRELGELCARVRT
jgi:hypothetical protein